MLCPDCDMKLPIVKVILCNYLELAFVVDILSLNSVKIFVDDNDLLKVHIIYSY